MGEVGPATGAVNVALETYWTAGGGRWTHLKYQGKIGIQYEARTSIQCVRAYLENFHIKHWKKPSTIQEPYRVL